MTIRKRQYEKLNEMPKNNFVLAVKGILPGGV